jgi:hypothetical protein
MSDNNNVQVRSGGIGFAGMLAILFIGLKLTNQIDWSWWWVLSPLWIPAAVILAILVACLVVAGILWLFIAFLDLFQKL